MPVGQEELLTWLLLSEGAGFKGGARDDRGDRSAGAGLSSGVINGAKFHNGQIVGGYELPKDASVEAAKAYLDSKRGVIATFVLVVRPNPYPKPLFSLLLS
jgi:hypothetical protein